MYTPAAIGFIILTILSMILLFNGVRRALQYAVADSKRRRRIEWGIFGVILFWMIGTALLSLSGYTTDFSGIPPHIAVVLLPPFFAILLLTFTPFVGKFLGFVPPAWLISAQIFRVMVEILLWVLYRQHLLPVQMTFEGRNFDILVGLTALPVVYFCFVRASWPKAVAIVWNIAGLVLLLNIVVIAILSMPTPLRVFMNEPANTIIGQFPFVWLPAVLVPLALSMHCFSLRQLFSSQVF